MLEIFCQAGVEKFWNILICYSFLNLNVRFQYRAKVWFLCVILGSSFILQHDSEPKHSASRVKAYLDRKAYSGILSHTLASPLLLLFLKTT